MRRLIIAIALTVALSLTAGLSRTIVAQDATPEPVEISHITSVAPVYAWPTEFWAGTTIPGAHSTYVVNDQGASVTIHTSGLTPGHTVTMWLVIFNNPEGCSKPTDVTRCGENDLLMFDGDAAIDGVVAYGSGQVIGPDGSGSFDAFVATGDASYVLMMGDGLTNPLGADVHVVLRDHGPVVGDLLADQLTTFGGGCNNAPEGTGTPGDYACQGIQFSAHEPTLETDS